MSRREEEKWNENLEVERGFLTEYLKNHFNLVGSYFSELGFFRIRYFLVLGIFTVRYF